MLAETSHESGGQYAEFAQQPAQHGQFKHDAHQDTHHQQCSHIGLKRYHIGDITADLISSQETECQREYQEIADAKN